MIVESLGSNGGGRFQLKSNFNGPCSNIWPAINQSEGMYQLRV